MKARYHLLTGGVAAAVVVPVFGVASAAFWASSVLVDVDHYLDYLCRNGFRDFSIKRMFGFHAYLFRIGNDPTFLGLNILHTAEFFLVASLVTVAVDWIWLTAALWGMVFHMAVDVVYLAARRRIFRRAMSVVEYHVRWRRLQRRGLQPERHYIEAVKTVLPDRTGVSSQ